MTISPRDLDSVERIPFSGCWIWTRSVTAKGYGNAYPSGPKHEYAHRLFYSEFLGTIPSGMCVLHRCDVRSCVNPDHLFLGTNQDNSDDMVRKGRHRTNPAKGAKHGMSKLTEADVVDIRNRLSNGEKQEDIAKLFGVRQVTISDIKVGKTWGHV